MRKMPRSDSTNRNRKDLRSLDEDSPEYWEEILRREGLSMSAGSDRRLIHVGSSRDLATVEANVLANGKIGGRRVKPKPQAE